MYTLYKFNFLNGISEINQIFDDILIIWPAAIYIYICIYVYIYIYVCVPVWLSGRALSAQNVVGSIPREHTY